MKRKERLKPMFRCHSQKDDADCAVAALAMALNLSYESVLIVASRIAPKVLTRGLYSVEIALIAEDFGRKLKKKLKVDLETDTGVLVVQFQTKKKEEHAMYLTNGLLFNTNGDIWEPEHYLKAENAKVLHLMTEED